MSNDIDDLTPFERVMRSSKRPAKVIDMPGYPGTKVAMLVPSDEELAEAQAAALQYLTGPLKLDEFKLAISLERNLFEAEEARQILVRVLRNPIEQDLPFATIDSLRKGLTVESRNMLMRILNAWKDERSPETKDPLEGDRMVQAVRDLKEAGGLPDYLVSCSFDTLVFIGLSLAEALPNATTQPS